MKALLIADSALAINNISQVLESAGYDVIVYKWLMKALDNIEEISPHLIIISAKEYPRHWKIMAQFASAFSGSYRPQVVLYAQDGLGKEEIKKAEILGVRGIFESVDVKGLDKLREILLKEPDVFSGKLVDENGNPVANGQADGGHDDADISGSGEEDGAENESIDGTKKAGGLDNAQKTAISSCGFMFENPLSRALVTGYAHGFDGKTLVFDADIQEFTENLSAGTKIRSAALESGGEYRLVQAVISEIAGSIAVEIC